MLSAQISHPLTKSMMYNDVTYLIRKRPSPSRGGKIKGFRFLLPFGPVLEGPVLFTPNAGIIIHIWVICCLVDCIQYLLCGSWEHHIDLRMRVSGLVYIYDPEQPHALIRVWPCCPEQVLYIHCRNVVLVFNKSKSTNCNYLWILT